MEGSDHLVITRGFSAARPLLGLTVLVVDDSRFSCEALRLLCRKSGARLRRADSLSAAGQHLAVYRPHVVLVDLGLPDGSGLDLIATLARARPRISVVLGISGDNGAKGDVIGAGADGFMAKPIAHLAAFQSTILYHLGPDTGPVVMPLPDDDPVEPDMIAYHDDLTQVARLLAHDPDPRRLAYIRQFLHSLARSRNDTALDRDLRAIRDTPVQDTTAQAAQLARLIANRISRAKLI
jgi:CheY-like chemotaxis protein